MGPTEILARRVMQEMGVTVPDLGGYHSEQRRTALQERMLGTLLESAGRNADREHEFFQRLDTISGHNDASADFHELQAASVDGVAHNHTYAFPDQRPQGDLGHLAFNNGTVSLFPVAHSASAGAPSGYENAYAASSASWDTQGRFFQYGKPVDGNPHVREFDFPDGSKVVGSAHMPQLSTSDLTNFGEFATVTGVSALGLSVGFVTGGAGWALAGAALGAGIGGGITAAFPYNRIWQGYTLDYYNKGEAKPFYTQSMYAWDSDSNRVGLLSKQKEANLWPDYADGDPDANWEWWKWKSGNAPLRT